MSIHFFKKANAISIHALREESDSGWSVMISNLSLISIHALREESDFSTKFTRIEKNNFNPRSPWGERRRRDTMIYGYSVISIHALREESDL